MDQVVEVEDGEPLTQGSLLTDVDWGITPAPVSIILTNPCDLENDKASFLLVAACKPAVEIFKRSKEFEAYASSGKPSKGAERSMARSAEAAILNKVIGRYFYFDATPVCEEEAWLAVDFQHLLCLDYAAGSQPGILLGRLQSPFCQQMLHSFASYVARVGVDRPEQEAQNRIIEQLVAVQ